MMMVGLQIQLDRPVRPRAFVIEHAPVSISIGGGDSALKSFRVLVRGPLAHLLAGPRPGPSALRPKNKQNCLCSVRVP